MAAGEAAASIAGAGVPWARAVARRAHRLVPQAIRTDARVRALLQEPARRLDDVVRPAIDATGIAGTRDGMRGLVLLGDSLAVSAGVTEASQTLGHQLARELATRTGVPVRVGSWAVSGTTTRELAAQLPRLRAQAGRVDDVVVSIGGNDVASLARLRSVERSLEDALDGVAAIRPEARRWLMEVPAVDNAAGLPQPLREVMGARADAIREVQHEVAARTGTRLLRSSELYAGTAPRSHVALDGFHPSAAGYGHAARAFADELLRGAAP